MNTIPSERVAQALSMLLEETFERVHGYYLDRHTSLFETLATVTAAEASMSFDGRCATLAAQVKHVAFYLAVVEQSMRHPDSAQADWGVIWRTVGVVTDDEWITLQRELRESYTRIASLLSDASLWSVDQDAISRAAAIVVHTAYHLGSMRLALRLLRS